MPKAADDQNTNPSETTAPPPPDCECTNRVRVEVAGKMSVDGTMRERGHLLGFIDLRDGVSDGFLCRAMVDSLAHSVPV